MVVAKINSFLNKKAPPGSEYFQEFRLIGFRVDGVRKLGNLETFTRLWEYYPGYCKGGFLEQSISDKHLVSDRLEHQNV